uniref:Uncharacterized protein n=1 Tax=Cucumis melo TaxID=3656 RepID=A0A9I9E0J3_CUCME
MAHEVMFGAAKGMQRWRGLVGGEMREKTSNDEEQRWSSNWRGNVEHRDTSGQFWLRQKTTGNTSRLCLS